MLTKTELKDEQLLLKLIKNSSAEDLDRKLAQIFRLIFERYPDIVGFQWDQDSEDAFFNFPDCILLKTSKGNIKRFSDISYTTLIELHEVLFNALYTDDYVLNPENVLGAFRQVIQDLDSALLSAFGQHKTITYLRNMNKFLVTEYTRD